MNQVSTEQMIEFLSKYQDLWALWLNSPDLTEEADGVVCDMHDLVEETFYTQTFGN